MSPNASPQPFPTGFLWGAATAAYQVEGSPLADGAGPSIWHRFAHNPGRIAGGDTGDIACDHYRRWAEDLDLVADLGLRAYRFSVAWGRVLPEGTGRVNRPGLDFYRRLADGLAERGIRPAVTLYHWDLPAPLADRGGWLNPDSPRWFAEYAEHLFRALDDRGPLWITLNEPWVATVLGHLEGCHAPGHRDRFEAPLVAHRMLLAHAEALAAYRACGRHAIGIAVNLEPQYPATPTPRDRAAALRRDAYINRWFLDPLLLGAYPPELPTLFADAWPEIPDSDLERIRAPLDFIGVNYYSRALVRDAPGAGVAAAERIAPANAPLTAMGWEVYPQGLTETLLRIKDRYGNPAVYITENGAAFDDPPPAAGEVADPLRLAYLRDHLCAAREAIARGADLRGYFAWSLLDNFEWAEGYAKRFGLYRVEPQTLARVPKSSARFYRDAVRRNGADLSCSAPPSIAGNVRIR